MHFICKVYDKDSSDGKRGSHGINFHFNSYSVVFISADWPFMSKRNGKTRTTVLGRFCSTWYWPHPGYLPEDFPASTSLYSDNWHLEKDLSRNLAMMRERKGNGKGKKISHKCIHALSVFMSFLTICVLEYWYILSTV